LSFPFAKTGYTVSQAFIMFIIKTEKMSNEQGGNPMKKIAALLAVIILMLPLVACGNQSGAGGGGSTQSEDKTVLIYSTSEEYRIAFMQEMLNEQFPDYDITIEYLSTGNLAAKLKAEGADTACDFIGELDTGYLSGLSDSLADLSNYDSSIYLDELVPADHSHFPMARFSGCITVNTKVLQDKGLAIPQSYQDLLKPEYKGLISMPNPKTSGTGYMFLRLLTNEWGEDEAFAYFDQLTPNILQYTESGSGPVNALVQGEVAIGFSMIGQTILEIAEGAPLEIVYFDGGTPYGLCGTAIIEGKQDDPVVKEVFSYYLDTVVPADKEMYFPEKIYRDRDYTTPGYPSNLNYGDMSNNTLDEKERLLAKWMH
jgi:iron(III) transport system substrate-binding protein